MDRGSDKKITAYAAVWLASILVTTVGMVCFAYWSEMLLDAQMTELSVMHPELLQALTENSRYYHDRRTELFGMLWGFLAFGFGMLCVVFYLMQRRDRKKQERREKAWEEAVIRQIGMFCRGDYSFTPFPDAEGGMQTGGTDWQRIYGLLEDLGGALFVWKRRMTEEENSTKALITDISHQLKTPLAALRMSHELTVEETLTDSERKEFAAKEELEIRRLELLLEELLKLSQLESGMIRIAPQDAGIRDTILNAVEQVFLKAHEKQIEIRVKQETDVTVRHDKKWMAEALSNILDNAVKYSKPQSPIEIRVNCMPGSVMIEIEDWGMGIAADELHKIFQRFYRGREAEKLVKDGAGVGLYLARSVIERQGGTIMAKRKANNGMIFRILLSATELIHPFIKKEDIKK